MLTYIYVTQKKPKEPLQIESTDYKKKSSMSVKLKHYNQIKFCIRVLATQHKKR